MTMRFSERTGRAAGRWWRVFLAGLLVAAIVLQAGPAVACEEDAPKPNPGDNPPTDASVKDTNKPDDCDNEPDDCDDECDPTSVGDTSQRAGCKPVIYSSGIVMETKTDLWLPGRTFGYSHTRTYNSRLESTDPQNNPLPAIQGKRWEANMFTSFLREAGDDIEVYLDAVHKRVFTYSDPAYDAPADFKGTLVHDTNDKEFELTLTVSGNTYVFYDFHNDNGNSKGLIKSRTDRYGESTTSYLWQTIEIMGAEAHRLTHVKTHSPTTPDATIRHIYGLDPNKLSTYGRLLSIEAVSGSDLPKGVVYVYLQTGASGHHNDCGTTGDLVLVHACDDLAVTGEASEWGTQSTLTHTDAFANMSLGGCMLVLIDGNNAGHIREIVSNTDSVLTLKSPDLPYNTAIWDSYFVVRGSIRTTHYRYYGGQGGGTDGVAHQLKYVLDPGTVEAMLSDTSTVLDSAMDVVGKEDSDDLNEGGGDPDSVEEYASKSFEYYTEPFEADTNQTTSWGIEDLVNKYCYDDTEGTALNETGYVKSETIRGTCGGCGGGITREYYYLNLNDGSSAYPNEVVRIVVEDTVDAADEFVRRKIFGLNDDRIGLREVTAIGAITSPQYWCQSTILGDVGGDDGDDKKIVERRSVSAHACVIHASSNIDNFLDPTGDGGDNDGATLEDSSGIIRKYYYNADGFVQDETVKNGETETEKMVSSTDYGDGVDDQLPTASYVYRTLVDYNGGRSHTSSGIQISYSYTFHDDPGETQLQTKTTTYPEIVSGENGPGGGSGKTSMEYYDTAGRLRWVKDPEDRITYYSYHPATGGLAYVMEDVDAGGTLHTDITTDGGGTRVAWSDVAPTGFNIDNNDAIQLVTKYEYDDQGRQTLVDGRKDTNSSYSAVVASLKTYTVYKDNQTLVFPAWCDTGDADSEPLLPIQVTETDDAGRTTQTYTVEPSKVELDDNDLPKGLDSDLDQDDYLSWTRNTYNDKGQLQYVDRYHDIPSEDDGSSGTNYYRTEYVYDDQGRVDKVNGANYVTTQTEYDALGRVKATKVGPTGEALLTVSKTYYDGATSSTLVPGDGNVTLQKSYYDASNSYDTKYKYDWRSRLTRTLSPSGVLADRYAIDNLGRVTEARVYGGITNIDASPPTATKLRAKTETSYDKLGRVYQSEVHEVDQSNGTVGGSMTIDYWYDGNGRQVKVKGPGNAFSKTIYDGLGRVVYAAVCTDEGTPDTAWDLDDDTIHTLTKYEYDFSGRVIKRRRGTSVTSDDTEIVAKTYYDADHDHAGDEDDWKPYATGAAVLEPSQTVLTSFVLTEHEHDTAGRVSAIIEVDPDDGGPLTETRYEYTYDDRDRERYTKGYKKSGEDWVLLAQVAKEYDGSQLKYEKVYEVNSGVASDAKITTYYYDGRGRTCKVLRPSGAFTKTAYDYMDRVTGTYLCSDEGQTTDADNLTDDTVVEQTLQSYDEASNVWLTRNFQRKDNGSGTGGLDPSNARVTYRVAWFDWARRTTSDVNYGTNGGVVIDDKNDDFNSGESGTPDYDSGAPAPGSSDDKYIVTKLEYDGYGQPEKVTNNRGKVTKSAYDSQGRRTHVIENYLSGDTYWTNENYDEPKAASDEDECRVTKYDYNDVGQITKRTAIDPNHDGTYTDNQETEYVYNTTGDTGICAVHRKDLLKLVKYPDGSTTGSDNVQFTYYANGARRTVTEQRGTVHAYEYDDLGRLTLDKISTLGTGVNGDVRRIEYTFDAAARSSKATSYNAETGGSVVNEQKYHHNGWGYVTKSYQAHGGVVDDDGQGGDSPVVQYNHTEVTVGSGKNIRLTSVVYPNGRTVHYNYPSSGIGAVLNREDNLASSDTPQPADKFAAYTYLGADTIIKADRPAVTGGLELTYGGSGTYGGFDRFGRIIDQKWENDSATAIDRYTYGYDKNSNRLYRKNEHADGGAFSELYHANGAALNDAYDQLDRIKEFRRGTLSTAGRTNDTISSNITRVQQFTPDRVGNWSAFKEDADGTNWDLEQTRSHNKVNEIDTDDSHSNAPGNSITASPGTDWVDPRFDAAGNMTQAPRPNAEGTDDEALLSVYDGWNRLVEVYKDNGNTRDELDGADTLIAKYRYDGLHRRIAKLIPNDSNWDRTDYYHTVSRQVIEERYVSDQEDEDTVATTAKFQYIWEDARGYLDAPILRDENKDPVTDDYCTEAHDERLYYCQDANFNVTAMIETDGTVAERYVYDPYGRVTIYDDDWSATVAWASSKKNEILFCGYRYDPETELYYVDRRYYHPTLGRWLSRDPSEYVDGSNLYEYVCGNPVNYQDPTGTQAKGKKDDVTRPLKTWTTRDWVWTGVVVEACKNGKWTSIFRFVEVVEFRGLYEGVEERRNPLRDALENEAERSANTAAKLRREAEKLDKQAAALQTKAGESHAEAELYRLKSTFFLAMAAAHGLFAIGLALNPLTWAAAAIYSVAAFGYGLTSAAYTQLAEGEYQKVLDFATKAAEFRGSAAAKKEAAKNADKDAEAAKSRADKVAPLETFARVRYHSLRTVYGRVEEVELPGAHWDPLPPGQAEATSDLEALEVLNERKPLQSDPWPKPHHPDGAPLGTAWP